MHLSDYHALYFAHELTKRCPADSAEKLAGALVDAQVDLNPHQVEAALFAFRSPLSKGALLADEVGLGKTIEAGLVLSQRWAERKRKLLVITPANLRKQWHQELQQKFFLPCRILEAKSYNDLFRKGNPRPFDGDDVVICSYQFAKSKASDVKSINWDLVVIDEAHRLRNVYKPSNVIANVLKEALAGFPKLLLTATPLQNSLLELYGLVGFIEEHAFGDLKSFREQYAALDGGAFERLKARLAPLCHHTLRRQVLEYVPYTKRHALVEEFTPDREEEKLYSEVSAYLQRDNLQALPASQRSLMTLVLRKLLASSSFAIAGALTTLVDRLKKRLGDRPAPETWVDEITADYDGLDETVEEWEEDADDPPLSAADRAALAQEVRDLEAFRDHARTIHQNAKGEALLVALEKAFAETARLGGPRKAIIFTESRKTQDYLVRLLEKTPYGDGLVLFNGTNGDARSKEIYASWLERNEGTDRATGSKTADMRSALVDHFRDRGAVMIATEAGAEGINLQFCALVINYDLPWNPQRIEQRIGRCHRYGQKHDVVVVNFVNQTNEADQRVFAILAEKFKLFEGVFGASDEVLGAIEAGVDFEKRIARIYQECRTPEQIRGSFEALQRELTAQIDEAMTSTRRKLLEHFDEEVHAKLKVNEGRSKGVQSHYERLLMRLTRHILGPDASFDGVEAAFTLLRNPYPDVPAPSGRYELPRRTGDAHLYRLGHVLAERVLADAKGRAVPPAEIAFDLSHTLPRVAALGDLLGQRGELLLCKLSVESMDQAEDHLLVAATTEAGELIDPETAARFFSVAVRNVVPAPDWSPDACLQADIDRQAATIRQRISDRNAALFEEEARKLDAWADDLKLTLERDIKDLDRQIKEARRAAISALGLEEKLAGQKQVKELEAKRNSKRKALFSAQDDVDSKRDHLISSVEGKVQQKVTCEKLFAVRWRVE